MNSQDKMDSYYVELGNYVRHYSTVRLAIISVVIWFSINILSESSGKENIGDAFVSCILFLFGYISFCFYTYLLFKTKNKQSEVGKEIWCDRYEKIDIKKPLKDLALISVTLGFIIYLIFLFIYLLNAEKFAEIIFLILA